MVSQQQEILDKIDEVLTRMAALEKRFDAFEAFQKGKSDDRKAELKMMWDDMYEDNREELAYQVNHGTTDWRRLKNLWNFESLVDVQFYIRNKLKEDGLLK